MSTTPALIDGEDVTSGSVAEVRSPFSGDVVGEVPVLGTADIDRAVAVAVDRHLHGPLPTFERAAILDRAAILLTERREEFAQSICAEAGKPISIARVEATRAVDTFRFSAAVARTHAGNTVPMDAGEAGVGKIGWIARVPIGVIAAVSPFNFPLNLVAHKVAPAIAAGCPVVLKPASATPLTALRLARLLADAGLPPGWLNVVTVPGSVADHLVTHPDVAMVTFTGSPEVGWSIRSRAPRKKVGLELGNNAPVIVDESADLDLAATKIVAGGYNFSGQVCISVQRVYAHRAIHDELSALVTQKAQAVTVGDPSDDATVVSALINSGETQRVCQWVDEAIDQGARPLLNDGVDPAGQGVLTPVVLDQIQPEMQVASQEVFGPVVGIAPVDTVAAGIAFANDTRYGLQAAVFTSDLSTAMSAGATLDFGGVLINEGPAFRTDQMPYGGLRDSGNTREGPAYAIDEMTERRLIVIQT